MITLKSRKNWLLPLERRLGDQASLNQLLVKFLVSFRIIHKSLFLLKLIPLSCRRPWLMRATGVIFSSPDALVVVVLFNPTIHSSTALREDLN